MRRLGTLVATVLIAAAVGHAFMASTAGGERFTTAVAGTPAHLADMARGEFGSTGGKACDQRRLDYYIAMCGSYRASSISTMLRERVPVEVSLLIGGLIVGTLLGVAGGRWCATRPETKRTRALHLATALQLSTPPYLLALLLLFYFSSNVSEFVRLPFLSGQGDYAPIGQDPLQYLKALWIPWILAGLPLAAFVLRITEARLGEELQEDFVRTARAKGLSERRVVNRHALPVTIPSIAAMTGVNVSTLLLNIAVIEYAYAIPGMFRVIRNAVSPFVDVPVLEGLVIEGVILITLANLLADAIQARLDPRLATRRA